MNFKETEALKKLKQIHLNNKIEMNVTSEELYFLDAYLTYKDKKDN